MFKKEVNTAHINLYFTIVVDCQSDIKVKVRIVTELNQSSLTKAYLIPPINEMNSLGIQALSHTSTTSSDKNSMTKVDRRNIIRKKKHTCFEWTQLIATICIPLIVAVYTIIENHNSELIAAADLHKDVEIANNSRTSGFEIAQADRLNEIIIAEQSRQNDRDLAVDQQRENILVQSLYEAKLITLKITSKPLDKSVLEFRHVDLSDLTLGSSRDSPDERPIHRYIDWYYLYLPYAILKNASFHHSNLDCMPLYIC
jgi:hypothetical protein